MPTKDEIRDVLDRTRSYFVNSLLPFWMNKSPDPEYGGFLSYFDRDGRPTGETDQALPDADPDAVRHVGLPIARATAAAGARSWPGTPPISSSTIIGTMRTKDGTGSPTARGIRPARTRSATGTASASMPSASISSPPAIPAAGNTRRRPTARSANTWPTRGTADSSS